MSMGKQNLDLKKKYLRELSGSKFHSVTSCNVIVYKLNFNHKWIYQVLEMSSSIIIVMAQQNSQQSNAYTGVYMRLWCVGLYSRMSGDSFGQSTTCTKKINVNSGPRKRVQ